MWPFQVAWMGNSEKNVTETSEEDSEDLTTSFPDFEFLGWQFVSSTIGSLITSVVTFHGCHLIITALSIEQYPKLIKALYTKKNNKVMNSRTQEYLHKNNSII